MMRIASQMLLVAAMLTVRPSAWAAAELKVGEAVSGEGDVLGAGVPDGGVVFPAVDEVDIFRFEGAETDGFDSHRVCFFDCLECGLGSVLVKDDKSGYDTRHPAADGKE